MEQIFHDVPLHDFYQKPPRNPLGYVATPLKNPTFMTKLSNSGFQFDWSTEYAFVGGLRRKLEVAHTKLCASRAFWLTAY